MGFFRKTREAVLAAAVAGACPALCGGGVISGTQTVTGDTTNFSGMQVFWMDTGTSADGDYVFSNSAIYSNNGFFTAENDRNFSGNGVFRNNGLFSKQNSSGTTAFYLAFNNSGTVLASSGTIQFNADSQDNFPRYNAAAGATIDFHAGNHTSVDYSNTEFSGTGGTVSITGGSYSSYGFTLAPEAGSSVTAVVSGGSLVTTGMDVGAINGGTGTLVVTGSGYLSPLQYGIRIANGFVNQNGGTINAGSLLIDTSPTAAQQSVFSGGITTFQGYDLSKGAISLGNSATTAGSIKITGNASVESVGTEYIGFYGTGTVVQDGGENRSDYSLALGSQQGSSGSYTLSGTGRIDANNTGMSIGYDGTGSFIQNDSTSAVEVHGDLHVGIYTDSSGSYVLNGGSLIDDNTEYIASAYEPPDVFGGAGIFIQHGGTNLVRNGLTIGEQTAGTGVYTIDGGSLVTYNGLGVGPSGTFNASGGTVSLTGGLATSGGYANLYVAGVCNISKSAVLTVDANEYIYFAGGTPAVVTQTGGSQTINGSIYTGRSVGSVGNYYISGGTVSVENVVVAGDDNNTAGGTSTFVVSGGSLSIGFAAGSGGYFGTLLIYPGGTFVSQGGITSTGTVQNDGTMTSAGGATTATSLVNNGTLTASGGSLSVATATNNGVMNLSGGATSIANLTLAAGTFNLLGVTVSSNTLAVLGGANMVAGAAGTGNGGVMNVGSGGVVFSSASSAGLTLNADAAIPGRLILVGPVTVNGGSSTASILTGTVAAGQLPGTVDMGGTIGFFDVAAGLAATQLMVSARLVNGAVYKTGDGTMTLASPANSFTGGVTVEGGTLQITAASAFTGGVRAVASGPSAGAVSVDADGELGDPSNNLTLAGGTLLATGSFSTSRLITLGDATGNGQGTLSVSAGSVLTINGAVTGIAGLFKQGAGQVTLNGNLSYNGGTRVMAGTLLLGPGVALPALSVLNIAPGATFDLGGQSRSIGALQDALLPDESRAGGTVALGSATLTFGSLGNSPLFSGTINGSTGGAIVMLGSSPGAVTTLTGPLTNFTGGIGVNEGTLILTNPASTFAGSLNVNGAALEPASDGALGNAANAINLSAGGTLEVTTSFVTARNFSVLAGGGTIAIAPSNTLTSSGTISGAAPLSINGTTLIPGFVSGCGTLILTSAQPFTGSVTVDGSTSPNQIAAITLQLSGNGSLPSVSGLTLIRQGTLAVYDSSGMTAGRLSAATALNLSGGTLEVIGPASATAVESLGAVSLPDHTSSTIDLIDGAGGAVDLTLSSLQLGTGASLQLVESSPQDRLFFTTPPAANFRGFITGISLTDAGVTSLHVQYSPTLGIVPFGTTGTGIIVGSGAIPTSVPEPAGLSLTLLMSAALLSRRRRRVVLLRPSICF